MSRCELNCPFFSARSDSSVSYQFICQSVEMIRPGNGQIDDQQRNPRSEIVTNASVDYQHTLPVVSERYLEAVIYNVKKQSK